MTSTQVSDDFRYIVLLGIMQEVGKFLVTGEANPPLLKWYNGKLDKLRDHANSIRVARQKRGLDTMSEADLDRAQADLSCEVTGEG